MNKTFNRGIRLAHWARLGLTATAVAAAGSALAAGSDSGWYGGINLGRSSLDSAGTDAALNAQGVSGNTSIDKHDTTWGLNLGYQFNRNFAVEGGYVDFGKFNGSAVIASPAADTVHGSYKIDGWSLVGVGILPLDKGFAAYGKLGAIYADTKLSLVSDSGAVALNGVSKSTTSTTYGLGVSYQIDRNLFGKVEWNRYQGLGSEGSTGRNDLDTLSVGLNWKF